MPAIPSLTAASPGGGDVSIRMPATAAATAAAAGGVVPQPKEGDGGAPANSKPENHLSRFVRYVAFGEWAGNAFGALAFVWATGVLLGGFCASLYRLDFWFATILILIEAFRMAVFVTWVRRLRRPKQWQIRVLAIAYVLSAAIRLQSNRGESHVFLDYMLPDIIEVVAVLILNLRHQRIANLTSTPCGRKLIFLAKVTSALLLASDFPLTMISNRLPIYKSVPSVLIHLQIYSMEPFALLVLSLGSLQNHAASSLFGRWTDAIMHISFLFYSVVSFPLYVVCSIVPGLSSPLSWGGLAFVLLLVLLLSGNLQIPAAVAQIVLSSLRLINLLVAHIDYHGLPKDSSRNTVAAIAIFYVLALCQGSFYIMASFLGLLSCFPRRWLMRRSNFGGKLGAKAVDLYYDRAYGTLMEMGMFGAAGSTMTFADFAIESLNSSSSRDLQVAGLCVLHHILQERRDCNSKDFTFRVTSSSKAVSTLVSMLAWTDVEDDGNNLIIRHLAAWVTAELAGSGSLRISSIPGMLKLVSSLLMLSENTDVVVVVPNQQGGPGQQQTPLAIANGGWWRSLVVCRFWQRMKQEYWSVPEEPNLLTHQDSSLPVLGMQILEKLARDLDNCAEIFKDDTTNLISKTIAIIGLATVDNEQNDALVCSSLEFLRRLATTGERIGAALRQELWRQPFLLTCLARVLEDDRSPQVWEPAMDIIAKLALDSAAGPEIGRNQVITASLLHGFLGRHRPTNMYYDQSLRKVSGEALANLSLWGSANCSAILEEPGYQVISDLANMLFDDDYRYVAATLLLNLCAHSSVTLLRSHPHAIEHLSSALTIVVEHIMAAEGKQLESLINVISEIGGVVREALARELESQTNRGAELVQKLLCTLNSKKIPNPEYPRMRRVIVKILISILESCHGTVEKLMEEGMVEQLMESLTKIQRSLSRVEEYRVFYGNIGVVPEDGEPMSTLVARAKALLVRPTSQTTAGAPTSDHL